MAEAQVAEVEAPAPVEPEAETPVAEPAPAPAPAAAAPPAVKEASKNWKSLHHWKPALQSFQLMFGEERVPLSVL